MDAADFVPFVERIMRVKGWTVGAAFQQRWANSPANQLVGKSREGNGTSGPLQSVAGKMDWVLGFARARDLYAELKKPEVFANAKARPEIKKIAERNFQLDPSKTEVELGNFAAVGVARESEFVNHKGLDEYDSLVLDDLLASIGRVSFFAIPGGTAKRVGSTTEITITKVGIYFRDSFDFNDEQNLGWWRLPDEASTHPPQVNHLDSVLRCSTAWFGMHNRVYRLYRERTGRGADFLIHSDVKESPLAKPVVFAY